jgi:serine protease Do
MARFIGIIAAIALAALLGAAVMIFLAGRTGPEVLDRASSITPVATAPLAAADPAQPSDSDQSPPLSESARQTDEGALIRRSILSVVSVHTPTGSCGTGFAVARAANGTVVATCEHVIGSDVDEISAILPDGARRPATLLSDDDASDVAFILLDGVDDLPLLVLGDSGSVRVTDRVYVVGFALGPLLLGDPSVTQGIVSGRRLLAGVDWLQTDAVINPGNSGGPVLNRDGEVVGVASWKIIGAYDAATEGLGFAASSNLVMEKLELLELELEFAQSTPSDQSSVTNRSGVAFSASLSQ